MRISDWSSDVCSSDLLEPRGVRFANVAEINLQLLQPLGQFIPIVHPCSEPEDSPLDWIAEDVPLDRHERASPRDTPQELIGRRYGLDSLPIDRKSTRLTSSH